MSNNASHANIDPEEINRFSAIADEWWKTDGKFAPLHRLNPLRLGYIRQQAAAHFDLDLSRRTIMEGLSIVDIGCGGGLLCEPLARMGGKVTGLDPAEESIKAASAHAEKNGLKIDYRAVQAEDVADNGEQFDIVINMEVIEHVPDVPAFIKTSARLLRPGGLMLLSTLNRTPKSFALAIMGAEYILNWVPRGTHHWNKFVTPGEMERDLLQAGLVPRDFSGMVYGPLSGEWSLSSTDLEVNYLATAVWKDDLNSD